MTNSITPMGDVKKETVSTERLREQGVEVLRRLSTAKVSLSDASFIAAWVTDARAALRQPDTRMEGGGRKVPDGHTPLDDQLGHKYLDVLNEGAASRDSGKSSPYHGHSLEHCLHAHGWVQRDLRIALDALQAQQPVAYADPRALSALKGTPARQVYLTKTQSPAYSMPLYSGPVAAPSSPTVGGLDGENEICERIAAEMSAGKEGRTREWMYDIAKEAAELALSAAQSSIQRAERERDEAIDRAKVWEHYWQQEVKVKGEVISWCKDYQTRIAALEAQLAEARKVLEPFAFKGLRTDLERFDGETQIEVHFPRTSPRKATPCGRVYVEDVLAARAFLASLGEKQDADALSGDTL